MRRTGACSPTRANRSSASSPAGSPSSAPSSGRSSGSSRRPSVRPRRPRAFLQLLPDRLGTLRLRHAIEVRHPSFACAEFVELARRHGVATVFADTDEYPSFADPSADFVYARLMRCEVERARPAIPRLRCDLGETARASGPRAASPRGSRASTPPPPRDGAARRVPVLHQRRQGARPGGGSGPARGARPPVVRSLIRTRSRQQARGLAGVAARQGPGRWTAFATRRGCGRRGRWRSRG